MFSVRPLSPPPSGEPTYSQRTVKAAIWQNLDACSPPAPGSGNLHVGSAKTSEHPLWLWPNLLSLDAPLIAVLWLHLFALSGRIRLAPSVLAVLALVVWTIYVADRLIDGLKAGPSAALSARHRFYRRHRAVLIPLLFGVLGVTCWMCLRLDLRTLAFGILLLLVVSGYFAAVHWIRSTWRVSFPKEAVVAVVFGVGTLCPAWIHAHGATEAMAIALAFFIAICWLNVVLIEYAEWAVLRQHRRDTPHVTTVTGGRHLLAIGAAIGIAALLLARVSSTHAEHSMLIAVSCSALALAGLGISWRKLSINAVRVLADATLLTPGLVLLFIHR